MQDETCLETVLNSLRIEKFDVVVDLTSSPVPTRTNVSTNYIRTSFPFFNKGTSFYSYFNLVRFWMRVTSFTAACCSNVIASKNNSSQRQRITPVMTRGYSLRLSNQVRYHHVTFSRSRDSENFKISRDSNFMLIKLVIFAFWICIECH